MKTKHYYDFGGRLHSKFQGVELNKGNWDALRMDAVEGSFSLERSVEEYEENCEKSTEYKERGRGNLPSFGVGRYAYSENHFTGSWERSARVSFKEDDAGMHC